jgi:hypothetical protein
MTAKYWPCRCMMMRRGLASVWPSGSRGPRDCALWSCSPCPGPCCSQGLSFVVSWALLVAVASLLLCALCVLCFVASVDAGSRLAAYAGCVLCLVAADLHRWDSGLEHECDLHQRAPRTPSRGPRLRPSIFHQSWTASCWTRGGVLWFARKRQLICALSCAPSALPLLPLGAPLLAPWSSLVCCGPCRPCLCVACLFSRTRGRRSCLFSRSCVRPALCFLRLTRLALAALQVDLRG